jgi:hypothetical protein
MTKDAQVRVAALVREAWGGSASVEREPDGGVRVSIDYGNGSHAGLVVSEESSMLLTIFGGYESIR